MVARILIILEWDFHASRSSGGLPDAEFWRDTSGSWGCGALCGGLWLQLQWVPASRLALASIAAKEFLLILLASMCGVNCGRVAQSGVTATMKLSCRLSMGGMLEILCWHTC